jgi:hypothetical protein
MGERKIVGITGGTCHAPQVTVAAMPDLVAAPSAPDLVGALAEPRRLAVFAALVLGAGSTGEVAARTGLPARDVDAAVRRLRACGLVDPDGLATRPDVFKTAAREAAAAVPPEFVGHPDADVLRAFIRGGQLLDLPADGSRRRTVLHYIAGSAFERGIRYREPEVNERLGSWGALDHATLRRYLVDLGLLDRAAGEYWLA